MRRGAWVAVLFLAMSAGEAAALTPVGSGFTYQGRLDYGGTPANGSYDFRFTLWDAPSGGMAVAGPMTVGGVGVVQGLFTTTLDFGAAALQGQARWLEIEVQPAGGSFSTLAPRQPLAPSPYAVFSSHTDPANLTSLNAGNLTAGVLPDARLAGAYTQALALSNAANAIAGTFTGDGFALTNLSAASLVGTIPGGALAGAYPNAVSFANPANAFSGDGSGLTNLNAQAKYARTVVVSPVGAPPANGTALLAALTAITTASDSNPWLLKIEPGVYDVASSSFVMKPFVDVEGSGETMTTITGLGSSLNNVGTVRVVDDSELRWLTVENRGGASFAKPIYVSNASPRISHVTARGFGAMGESQGIFVEGASAHPILSDVTIRVSASGTASSFGMLDVGSGSVQFNLNAFADGGGYATAVWTYGGAAPTMRNVVAIASGAVTESRGVVNVDSSPQMENVVAIATGGAAANNGVINYGAGSAPLMRLVACRGIGATSINRGCFNTSGGQPTMSDIAAVASGGASAVALENNGAGGGLSLTRIRAAASGASANNWGMFNNFSSPRIVDLETFANATGSATAYGIVMSGSPSVSHATVTAGGNTTGFVIGVQIAGSSSAPVFDDVVVRADGTASSQVAGIWTIDSATGLLRNVSATVFGGSNLTAGVFNDGTNVTMKDVAAEVRGSGGEISGIRNHGATVNLTNVNAMAAGAGGNRHGIFNNVTASTVTVERSTLSGATNSILNGVSSTTRVALSKLVGTASNSGGTLTCLLSYNDSFVLLNPACQ